MRKTIGQWYLYDFANSFATIVLLFYYPLMLSERGANNTWIGVSASISTGLLLFILPHMGADSDKKGRRIFYIKILSILMIISLFTLAYLMQSQVIFSIPMLILVSIFYILFQVSFQSSYVFYSAMLRSISSSDNNVKISGFGLGIGQLGNAAALAIIGPLAGSSLVIVGLQGKPLALFLGGLIFTILAVPFLLQKESKVIGENIVFSYRSFLERVFKDKRIFYFLIGYALLADAILTFQLYITLYVKKVFLFTDQLVTYAGITGLLFGVLGGFIAFKLAKVLKDKEKALHASSLLYATCFGVCALMPQVPVFVFFGLALSGFSFGLVFSLSRAVYSELTPEHKQAEFFSIFTVFERTAAVVGPLVWLLTFYLLSRYGEAIQYRGSIFLLLVVCLSGVYFLRKSNGLAVKHF